MSPPKQISFIEKVYNSRLGLEGMQIVVYSDRARFEEQDIIDKKYNFTEIGHEVMETINGEIIKEKYKIKEGEELGRRLHKERIKWIKQIHSDI